MDVFTIRILNQFIESHQPHAFCLVSHTGRAYRILLAHWTERHCAADCKGHVGILVKVIARELEPCRINAKRDAPECVVDKYV